MAAVPTAPADLATYLDIYLGPLADALGRPDVTDLYVNRPGELWVETLGGGIERVVAPGLTEALLWRLARQIASLSHQGISREHPLLGATLADGSRVQLVAPPAAPAGMAVAIRKHLAADYSLDDLARGGLFDAVRGKGDRDPVADALARLHAARDWAGFLRAAVRARKTILVSGGTSTGKTTFLAALIREIDAAERLVLIEDTPELKLSQPNAVALVASRGQLGEASVTPDDLLIAALRMRPDRIILGELRGSEAFTFLRAINTGHPGSMTTVHADTPDLAVQQIALMVLQAGLGLSRADVVDYVRRTVDVVVQLGRHGGRRRVQEIAWQRSA